MQDQGSKPGVNSSKKAQIKEIELGSCELDLSQYVNAPQTSKRLYFKGKENGKTHYIQIKIKSERKDEDIPALPARSNSILSLNYVGAGSGSGLECPCC